MESGDMTQPFEFSQENVDRLKTRYSVEMKDDPNNPIKVCMKLVFEAALEKDPEKKQTLSLELSRHLTRPDGVINLFLALVDFDASSQKITTHNQRFLAVAKIITLLPKLCMPYHEYCKIICRQLRPLLVHPNSLYSSLAAIIMKTMLENAEACDLAVVTNVVLGPIVAPLTGTGDEKFKISQSIIATHNLIQNHSPKSLFTCNFSNLFFSLVTLYNTPSQLKGYLKWCLIEMLNDLKPGPACCLLDKTIFHDSSSGNIFRVVTDDDEITLEVAEHTEPPDWAVVEEVVIELLEGCDNHPLVMEYFFHFQAKLWTSCDGQTTDRCAALIEPLLCQTIEEKPESKLDISAEIMADSALARDLINKTLMHYLNFLRVHQRDTSHGQHLAREAHKLAESSLGSCLNILQVLCSTSSCPSDVDMMQGKTLPILREIKAILVDSPEGKPASDQLVQSLDSLIGELMRDSSNTSKSSHIDEARMSQQEHQSILRDLNHKLVPVRVHALVRLRQMLVANDKHTIRKISELYPMVESSLADQEPYVFLASINLLAEMALRQTEDILPRLIELHASPCLDVQQRINVGEVLVRLTARMNATTPHYAPLVMNALLKGTTDSQELIRMSSLTNIGTLAGNLSNSLGKHILDILASIQTILDSDTIQVKCAAVDLLRTALMGLDRQNVESVQRDLKSIYALLKKLANRTLDENLCLQVDLALKEIARLARDIIGVSTSGEQQRLVKNIKVLSLD